MTGSALNQVRTVASPATPTPRRSAQETGGFRSVLEMPQRPAREPDTDVAPRRDQAIIALALALDGSPIPASQAEGEAIGERDPGQEIGDPDELADLDVAPADEAALGEPKPARTDVPAGWLIAAGSAVETPPRPQERRPSADGGTATLADGEMVNADADASGPAAPGSRSAPAGTIAAAAAVAPMLASESKPADTARRKDDPRTSARGEAAIKSGVKAEEHRATPVAMAENRAAVRLPAEAEVEPARPLAGALVTGQQSFAAPQTPATTVAAVLGADASWSAYFREAATGGPAAGGVKSLKIQLHPAELGVVTATLRVSGDAMTVELQADTEQARRHLAADTDQIVRSLRALGMDIDKVTVQAASSDDTGQRQQAAGGREGGFASAGGSNEGRNGRSATGGANAPATGDDCIADTPSAAEIGRQAGDSRII